MKKFLTSLAFAASAAAVCVAPASAAVLTFDDLNTGSAGSVPASYAGFTLNGWWHIDNPPYSFPYASAPTIIYNSESNYTNTPEIVSATPIDVLSVYLADFSSGSVTLLGYSGSSLLYSSTIALGATMTQYALNFEGIDRFVMQTTDGVTFAFLDNFEYANANTVPEPGSLALLAVGLIGGLGIRSRRKSIQS